MTDEDYAAEIDAEAVAHARRKPWPAPGTVRRVRVNEAGDPVMQRQLAEQLTHQRMTEDAELRAVVAHTDAPQTEEATHGQ